MEYEELGKFNIGLVWELVVLLFSRKARRRIHILLLKEMGLDKT